MKKNMLITNYSVYIIAFLAVLLSSSAYLDLIKYYLLLALGAVLFMLTVQDKKATIYHNFNLLYLLGVFGFVIYAAFFKGFLYPFISILFFLASLMALAMGFYYQEPLKIKRPKKPVVSKPVHIETYSEEVVVAKPVVKRQVKRPVKKQPAKKTVKKTTKKAVAKKATKTQAPKPATRKKLTKKEAARLARIQDANLISFEQDHEVAYILRKNGKRLTKSNKELLVDYGRKFKANSRFKPHNRKQFDNYMKTYKVLKRLE